MLCLERIQHNTSLSTTIHIFKHGGGFFRGIKCYRIELSRGKILEENLVQSAFQHTLGEKTHNLKHKGKYTLELLAKTTLKVPKWPSYSFDLHLIENGCLAMINNQLDRAWRIV